ncbi:putative disease resistance protein RGA3 [Silene latifolia]|uniref:putative disease resistance protein RGA3 n=1 Tax=Silene latifolia TaxID=37657 RepID=UPI003D7779AB
MTTTGGGPTTTIPPMTVNRTTVDSALQSPILFLIKSIIKRSSNYHFQSLLTNLGSRALNEVASTWGIQTHVGKLKNTINTIKDVMLDAEERQVESHTVRGWLDRLRPVVFAADDLFDECTTMASQRAVMGSDGISKKVLSFFSHSNQIAFAFSISNKIKKIREELDDIVKDSSEFALVLRPHEESEEKRLSRQVRGQTHSFIAVDEVIGREDDREAIIDIMMASHAAQEQRLAVIPIVGIGGLGKTTLAQLLYNDERVEKNFELKLWVCVSEVFDVMEITKKIIMSATNSKSQNLEMDQLQGQLRKEIGGKKYLLVLDDVWNEKPEEWRNLKALLMVGGEGSQILVTTRSRKVADIMGSVQAYELNGLSEEKTWKLFEKMAFNPGESQKQPQLVKLAEEILKRCVGVPLAIRSLGTLLRGEEEWKWISIAGTSFVNLPDKQNNVMAILKLSYHHLLSPLKNCFAYCALFPKDYKFETDMLIDLWMAEGFVIPSGKTQCLDLCHEYLMQLLQRCFFQDITRDEWGNISSFKMHDLMHDLAIEVAGIQSRSKVGDLQDGDINAKIRHLSFDYYYQTDSWEIPSYMLQAKQLRTFLLPEYNRSGSYFNKAILQQLISNFRCLRVLDMRDRGVKDLPKSIGKLIHLRYLNLSLNPKEELPHSVTGLYNLQTLILYGCQWLRALPIHTRKLTNLRNLNTLDCKSMTHMPSGLGELTSLHKLPVFIVKCKESNTLQSDATTAQLRDLKTLNNLSGSLKIIFFNYPMDPASEANLHGKHRLIELALEFDDCGTMDHDEAILEGLKPHQNLKKLDIKSYKGRELPSWAMRECFFKTLPNLVEVHLLLFPNCREVPSFSRLPFLKRMSVRCFPEVEYMERSLLGIDLSLSPPQTFFPSLEELRLSVMFKLKGWWEDIETIDYSDHMNISHPSSHHHPLSLSFSKLTKLEIQSCEELKTFPLCPIVEELTLWDVNKHLTLLPEVTSSQASGDVGLSVTTSEYCSKLKTLSVDEVEHLFSLPRECLAHITSLAIKDCKLLSTCILKEVFQHLPSLVSLTFLFCSRLTSIFEGLEHLTSLESLVLRGCKKLSLSQNRQVDCDMPWKSLKSIRSLGILYIPELHHLPNGLQHLTKLISLKLQEKPNLEALPEWISCFSSLEYMRLFKCPKLTCLPEGFSKLTTLYELEIEDCPGLTNRCAGPTCGDWPKIQHIPLLSVKENSKMIYRVSRA